MITGKTIISDIVPYNLPYNNSLSQDLLDSIDLIKIHLTQLETNETCLIELWIEIEKFLNDAREVSLLGDGVNFVTNWILGTAETMLNEQSKVGFDIQTAEDLRNKHEAFELKCWDTYGFYAKLLYKINKFSTPKNSHIHTDLLLQRDFMNFVCRSFAGRLERRRNVLIISHRFFRMVSEYFDKTNDVFQSLVMGIKIDEFDKAKDNLKKLKDSQQYLGNILIFFMG